MTELLKKIEREAQKLTPQQRVILADRLMNSLGDDDSLNDVEMQWLSETDHRSFEDPADHKTDMKTDGILGESDPLFK